MSPDEALRMLNEKYQTGDPEYDHYGADQVLVALVREHVPRGDEIAAAYEAVEKWFA